MPGLEPPFLKMDCSRGSSPNSQSVVWHFLFLPCLHPCRCLHTHVYAHPTMSPHPTSPLRSWQREQVFFLEDDCMPCSWNVLVGKKHIRWVLSMRIRVSCDGTDVQRSQQTVTCEPSALFVNYDCLDEFLSRVLLVSGGRLYEQLSVKKQQQSPLGSVGRLGRARGLLRS